MATVNLDKHINYVEFYRARLKNFKDKGDQLIANCPFHDDTKQHLYINSKTSSNKEAESFGDFKRTAFYME